jgi:hypothetical protein
MFETNFSTLVLTLGRIGKKMNHTKFWWESTFTKHPFEDQEEKEWIPMRWILGGLKSALLCDPCIQTDMEMAKPTEYRVTYMQISGKHAHTQFYTNI